MPPKKQKEYICELCKKVFNQKIDYTRHTKDKKTPCISLVDIQTITQKVETTTDFKQILINAFKSYLNILRDNEGLTGEKALRNMSYFIILKLIEQHFGIDIDIDEYDYDLSAYEGAEEHKQLLLNDVRFTNLASYPDGTDLHGKLNNVWTCILSKHPATKNVFLEGKGFDVQRNSTFKTIITKLHALDLSNCAHDVLGNAYEEVIQDIMTGKVLGQFFTPPLVKKMMVELIEPIVNEDGTIQTLCDPTMGTGGFLITYMKHILKKAELKNITLNWEQITTEGIYGKELEPDTYQLAVSNMLISSGHMFGHLDRGDSIREPITRKFDNILANPPFGIKGLKYNDFTSELKHVYTPIKTDNAVSLFLQAIIYMLKINGKCAIVLPDGQDLFSKTNSTLIVIREYLLKTCDLKEIIYLPSGIFTYTSIKTCVFYFIKKKEGGDVLKVDDSKKKTNYTFGKTFQTSKVSFYDYNPYENVKNLLVEVSINDLVNNSYSLNYAEYVKEEETNEYSDEIVVKKLMDICEINYGTRIVKSDNVEGEFPVYGSGRATFTTSSYNRDDYNILIGRFALSNECVRLTNEKLFLNDSGLSIKPKIPDLLHKYIGYYFLHNQDIIYNCARGTAQKNLEIDNFKKLQIPIPSLEKQQQIVEYLDYIYEKCIKTSEEKIKELKKLNQYRINNQKMFGDNEVKKLSEISKHKSGKRLPSNHTLLNTPTPYPYIRISDMNNNSICSNNIKYISNDTKKEISNYIITTNDIYVSIAGTIGLVGIIPETLNNANLTENAVSIRITAQNILHKYVMYTLHYAKQDEFKKLIAGAAIPKLSIEKLMNMIIIIPSIEKQQEIVQYCEENDSLIEQLEMEIQANKDLAQQFLTDVLKTSNSNNEQLEAENIADNAEIIDI